MNPNTRKKRIDAGLCINCGGFLDTNGKACSKCRQKFSEEAKERRQWYLQSGICQLCGKEKLYGSEKYCPECRAKRANQSEKQREKDRERYNKMCSDIRKRNYLKRKEEGLCTRCGKRKSETGKLCVLCHEKRKNYSQSKRSKENLIPRVERVSFGLCYTCGSKLDRRGRVCEKCANKMSNNLPAIRGGGGHWAKDNSIAFIK